MPILSIGNNVISSHAAHPRGGGRAVDHVRGVEKPPRLAVMILPADAREPRAGLRRRLRARYGIDQFQYVTLTPAEWNAIIEGSTDVKGVERFRGRLAMAMLGQANLIAVAGCAVAGRSNEQRTPRSWSDVQRLVHCIRSWDIPVPVVGIWTGDDGGAGTAIHAPGPTPVERVRDGYGNWLAVRRWEDDGGGWSGRASPTRRKNEHQSPGRQRVWHLIIESHLRNPGLGCADGDDAASTELFLDFDPVLPGWPRDVDDGEQLPAPTHMFERLRCAPTFS